MSADANAAADSNIAAMVEQANKLVAESRVLVLLSYETLENMRVLRWAQRMITMASSQRSYD
jgi:hypothetical protein